MNILILAAMDKEMELLTSLLRDPQTHTSDGLHWLSGKVGTHDVAVSKCGIGKVNAALNAYRLIQALHPGLVINSGVAGGAGLPIGTTLVADAAAYSDVWCGPGTEPGAADGFTVRLATAPRVTEAVLNSGLPVAVGLIATGDRFISTADEIAAIRALYPDVKAVDMESAAIAQACTMCAVPFAIIRVVSDTPGEGENIEQYRDFWSEAPRKTFDAVRAAIERL